MYLLISFPHFAQPPVPSLLATLVYSLYLWGYFFFSFSCFFFFLICLYTLKRWLLWHVNYIPYFFKDVINKKICQYTCILFPVLDTVSALSQYIPRHTLFNIGWMFGSGRWSVMPRVTPVILVNHRTISNTIPFDSLVCLIKQIDPESW